MRALNSRAAKISEKWAMLHFPLEDKPAQTRIMIIMLWIPTHCIAKPKQVQQVINIHIYIY